MKIIVINGSPRKNGNTATLLNEVKAAANSKNADVEMIHLYDLNFKGCISCFACKRIGGKSYGKCAIKDDLAPVLERIEQADTLVLGTPIYWGGETGVMRSFLERLQFQYILYDKARTSLAPKKINTAVIYTMNVTESVAEQMQYQHALNSIAEHLQYIFGSSQILVSYNTYQFDDYSQYETSAFSLEEKEKQKIEQFPLDRKKAFQMGIELATEEN